MKLFNLIRDYSKEDNVCKNIEFIINAVNLIVEEKDLQDYIKSVSIADKIGSPIFYDYLAKELIVNIKQLNYYLYYMDQYKELLKEFEQKIFNNVIIVQQLLKGIEFANQYRIISLRRKKEEGLILDLVLNGISDEYIDKLLLEGYDRYFIKNMIRDMAEKQAINEINNFLINPRFRFAEIKSFHEVKSCFSYPYIDIYKNLISFLRECEFQALISGYESIKVTKESPTLKFLRYHGRCQDLHKFNWFDRDYENCLEKVDKIFGLKSKLFYGLPISEEEFLEVSRKYSNTKKARLLRSK